MNYYTIYEVYPISCPCDDASNSMFANEDCPHQQDECRMVETFDNQADAEIVLKALKQTKGDDTLYKIQMHTVEENIIPDSVQAQRDASDQAEQSESPMCDHDCGCEDCLFNPLEDFITPENEELHD